MSSPREILLSPTSARAPEVKDIPEVKPEDAALQVIEALLDQKESTGPLFDSFVEDLVKTKFLNYLSVESSARLKEIFSKNEKLEKNLLLKLIMRMHIVNEIRSPELEKLTENIFKTEFPENISDAFQKIVEKSGMQYIPTWENVIIKLLRSPGISNHLSFPGRMLPPFFDNLTILFGNIHLSKMLSEIICLVNPVLNKMTKENRVEGEGTPCHPMLYPLLKNLLKKNHTDYAKIEFFYPFIATLPVKEIQDMSTLFLFSRKIDFSRWIGSWGKKRDLFLPYFSHEVVDLSKLTGDERFLNYWVRTLLYSLFEEKQLANVAANTCMQDLMGFIKKSGNVKEMGWAGRALYLLTADAINKVALSDLKKLASNSPVAKTIESYLVSPYHNHFVMEDQVSVKNPEEKSVPKIESMPTPRFGSLVALAFYESASEPEKPRDALSIKGETLLRALLDNATDEKRLDDLLRELAKSKILSVNITSDERRAIQNLVSTHRNAKTHSLAQLIMLTRLEEKLEYDLDTDTKEAFKAIPEKDVETAFRWLTERWEGGNWSALAKILSTPFIAEKLSANMLGALFPRILYQSREDKTLGKFLTAVYPLLGQQPDPRVLDYIKAKVREVVKDSVVPEILWKFLATLPVQDIREMCWFSAPELILVAQHMTAFRKKCDLFQPFFHDANYNARICQHDNRIKILLYLFKEESYPQVSQAAKVCMQKIRDHLDQSWAYKETVSTVRVNQMGKALYLLTTQPVDAKALKTLQEEVEADHKKTKFWSSTLAAALSEYLEAPGSQKVVDLTVFGSKQTSVLKPKGMG